MFSAMDESSHTQNVGTESTSPSFENYSSPIKQVVVHRTTICNDMIEIFKDVNILEYILNFSIKDANRGTEKGEKLRT